jgi:hypothetical protein
LVLFALYGSIVLGSLFPIQLMAPAWQLKIGSALINASPFPLIGLGLLHLAAELDPEDEVLIQRHSIAAQLAVAVSLGFLLLVPLLSVAAVTQQHQLATNRFSLVRRAETNLQALRQVVSSSNSSRELRDRLIALNGPVIDEANQAQPLSTLKAQVNGLIDQAAAQVSRQRRALPSTNLWSLFPELLRNAFASLALAIGFAALAWRRSSTIPFLGELHVGWDRFVYHKFRRRKIERPGDPDSDYYQEMVKQSEGEKIPPNAP